MFQPLIIYDPQTDNFVIHPLQSHKHQAIAFVSLIDVKPFDLSAINSQLSLPDQHSGTGLYCSDILEDNGKAFRYLYLPPLNGRHEQKFQDLLASICTTLSNLCIFSISSKYTRSAHQLNREFTRQNYVVLNTHGVELFKVKMQRQSNKIEIGDKVKSSDSQMLPEELASNLITKFNQKEVFGEINNIFKSLLSPKSMLNFEQSKTSFLARLRMNEYLSLNSKQYSKLITEKKKLCVVEMQKLTQDINDFTTNQVNDAMVKYLNKVKNSMIEYLSSLNNSLTIDFLDQFKKEHFDNLTSNQQFDQKCRQVKAILFQYNIDQKYLSFLSLEKSKQLYNQQIKTLNSQIADRDTTISNYQFNEKLLQNSINQLTQQLDKIQQQNRNFKQLNRIYQQTVGELEKERQINRKNKIEIESLIIERKSRAENEERLEGIIERMGEEKDILKKGIDQVTLENKVLEDALQVQKQQILKLQQKLKNYFKIERQATLAQENLALNQEKVKGYEKFTKELGGNLEAFKQIELMKTNYILERNNKKYRQLQEENKSMREELKKKENEKQKVEMELMQSKSIVEYCQQQMYARAQNDPNQFFELEPKQPLEIGFIADHPY